MGQWNTAMLFAAALSLSACGDDDVADIDDLDGGDSLDDLYDGDSSVSSENSALDVKPVVVEYDLTCDKMSCSNVTDSSSYESSSYQSVDCVWYCADYRDRKNVYVSIDFVVTSSEPCWVVESVYIDSGICP